MFEVLEHLRQDPLKCMAHINSVLKRGGHLILTTPNGDALNNILRIFAGDSPVSYPPFHGNGIAHAKEYSINEISTLLQASGFQIVQHTTMSPYNMPDLQAGVDEKIQHLLAIANIHFDMKLTLSGHTHVIVARKVGTPTHSQISPLYLEDILL